MQSRDDIGLVLNAMGLTGSGLELGVAFGENAEQILLKSKLELLYLVDPWNYVPDQNPVGYGDPIRDWQGCYDYCVRKLSPFEYRCCVLRMVSTEAASLIDNDSLDFIYIDANHMSPYIDEDLALWYGKLKSGGVFGGHDYYNLKNKAYTCDVKDAVDSFVGRNDIELHTLPAKDSSWYTVKP